MLTIRAMSNGEGYVARHLEQNDYYAEGERVTGEWYGHGAKVLGLSGPVNKSDFEAVRGGLDPRTKAFLRVRRSADRESSSGEILAHGRSLYDFTFSAPKSVSVMAIVGGDARLVDAHKSAVAEAMDEMERHAASRVRKGGANTDRVTGNMTVAVYHHDASRELDPQLHTHAVAANLTYDGEEGRWKALQASGIYQRCAYLTEVYRNSLARKVREMGYSIETRRDRRGRDLGFEIRGVPPDLLERFSQRSKQRDLAIEEFVKERGRQPTNGEIAVLVRESRASKLIEISTAEVRQRQRSRLSENERKLLSEVSPKPLNITYDSAAPSLEHAKDHVFERVSVALDHQVLTEALRHGRGRIRLADLAGTLVTQQRTGEVLRHGGEIATAASLEREREMIAAVNRGSGTFPPLGGPQFMASDRLRPEQKEAVEFILRSEDRAVFLSGAAGTGKTATLQDLRRGLNEAGHEVIAAAPTMSAVDELRKVGFANAVTLERLLQDPKMQSDASGKLLILDEAGMVSARQMAGLLRLAEERSFRIVFSGDTRQIQSVEAGDALRILEKESRLRTVSLTQVQRQTRKEYRTAMEALRENPGRAFKLLEAMGAVQEVSETERAQAVARAYAQAGSSSLVVCATHDEIDRVTEAIREQRKANGALNDPVTLARHVSLGWTAAQKADFQNYSPGQVLGFHKAIKGVAKQETVQVIAVAADGLTVRTATGDKRKISRKHAKSFDVLEARPIEVAPGDPLLITSNWRDGQLRFTNGELAAVRSVGADGTIRLEDGRVLPASNRNFAHGYAVTAHRSQGKSVDTVIVSADGMKRELFYVAASRGRESLVVITSARERLNQTIADSTARKSASELARENVLQIHRCRGLAAARELMRRAVRLLKTIPEKVTIRPMGPARKEERHVSLGR